MWEGDTGGRGKEVNGADRTGCQIPVVTNGDDWPPGHLAKVDGTPMTELVGEEHFLVPQTRKQQVV